MMQIFIYIKERVVKRKFHIILGLRNFSILWKNIKRDSFNFEMKRLKTILRTSNYEKSPLKVKRNEMGYVSSPLYWRNRTSSEGENPEGSKGSLSLGIRKNRNASRRGRETEGSYTPALRRDSRVSTRFIVQDGIWRLLCPGEKASSLAKPRIKR